MEVDQNKIESIIGVIQLKNSLKDEDRVEEEQLREAVGGDISNELFYLREAGAIELTEHADQSYIGFTEDLCDELGDEKPLNIDLDFEELEEAADSHQGLDVIEEEDLLDKGMELKQPEKYVAALKPFGDALEQNPEIALSEHHISSYVGEDLSFQLRTLTEWDYLTEVEPNEIGVSNNGSSYYRLNIDDREVQADAAFSAIHIRKYYGGSVEQFLNEYSDQDSDALRKNGINFYKAVG